eukprot:jgi/Mesen1/8293/ME000045S07742
MESKKQRTLGNHIASRLVEIGVKDFFAVPGDFNLVLLDQLVEEPNLNMVGCCNELNAGYAADGYARAKGVACVVVTFTVGGLSVINAIAGAYSESLPVICLVGGPNSNDFGTSHILHHTIGIPDFLQEYRCFQQVTCEQNINAAPLHRPPSPFISSPFSRPAPSFLLPPLALASCRPPTPQPARSHALVRRVSNPQSLEAAVEAAAAFLNRAVKPVLVAGPGVRVAGAGRSFELLSHACGYPVAAMPSAKGVVPESHPRFMGVYWGAVSSPFTLEIVESADAYLFAGPVFNDYSSVGYSLLINKDKMVRADNSRVTVGGGATFGCVLMGEFLERLAARLRPNHTAWDNLQRIYVPPGVPQPGPSGAPLRVNVLFQHIQSMLTPSSAVIAETGDSWFNCLKLHLPEGCGFEFQMQYGSIGWSVGATLGYAQAAKDKRVIACIGDGSFQVTAQDVSTMIRNEQPSIIFLINNGGYTIEVEIHDGPYNVIKNWNYTAVVEAFANGEGKCWTAKVRTEEELEAAIATATEKSDHLCFIETIVHKDDTSRELLEWGSRVSAANSRPPNPQ